VNHDDGEREFAYTELAENAMAEAAKRGWMVARSATVALAAL
jgi:hypothetical protein